MKSLCFSKILRTITTLLALLFSTCSIATNGSAIKKSAIVYYGHDISYSLVGIHDYIIVDPDNLSPYTHGFKTYKDKIYAYVSIGESNSNRHYFKELHENWKIGYNKLWGSVVLDISNEAYQQFLIDNVIQPMVNNGFKNFFFDTLDSYELVAKSKEDKDHYKRALIKFIKKFKKTFPNSKLIINRGFDIIDAVHNDIDAMLVESVFNGLSNDNLAYHKVKEEDRIWLLNKLSRVQKYGIDIIAVDYIDTSQTKKIKADISKLEALNFIPYITNKALNIYGQSSKNAISREILIITNSTHTKNTTIALRLLAMPIEYQGYIPIIKNIQDGLPTIEQLSRYKAVVVWLESNLKGHNNAFVDWIKTVLKAHKKLLFMSGFGMDDPTEILDVLGIKRIPTKTNLFTKQTITINDPILNFEAPVLLAKEKYAYQPEKANALLQIATKNNPSSTLIAKTSWGGYALYDYVVRNLADPESTQWVIDPFAFLKRTLELEDIPILDPTTENGRRLMFIHIDGDGSMNRVEWDPKLFSIEAIYEKILKKYKIPQSVSLVESETSSKKGLYIDLAPKLEKTAKAIFSLPYVEAASHTYSHPFYWNKVKNDHLEAKYRLNIKGYNFSLKEDILDSVKYVSKLQPKVKKKANLIFWSGDTDPNEEVLAYVYKHNILNINGGDTDITNDKPWLSLVSPYGIKHGEYIQTYTGAGNENIFTNDWTGPFWGYRKVIQTFQLTESPRRLQPLDIYYHFYAGSKTASLNALKDVYDWSLKQKVMPIYISEYIPKTLEFYDASIAKIDVSEAKNQYYFTGLKHLKTIRADDSLGSVDYTNNLIVLGQNEHNNTRYLHLNTQDNNLTVIFKQEGTLNYSFLEDSNAQVINYKKSKQKTTFTLKSHVPIELDYHLKKGCKIITKPKAKNKKTKNTRTGKRLLLKFNERVVNVVISCR
ncbi:MAG: endo alpha-1,4 polygalactosaminidase [Psychromonas sp.]|nr:endo alpha-1,4 polygalactosaminidase [Psychromonas sp.]